MTVSGKKVVGQRPPGGVPLRVLVLALVSAGAGLAAARWLATATGLVVAVAVFTLLAEHITE